VSVKELRKPLIRANQLRSILNFILLVPPDSENDANVSLLHLEEAMKNNTKSELTKESPYNGLVYLLSVLNNPKGTSFTEGVLTEF